MPNEHVAVRDSVLDELIVLHEATWDERDRARITALIDTLRCRQQVTGEALDSSYMPAFRRLLRRERQRQRGVSA